MKLGFAYYMEANLNVSLQSVVEDIYILPNAETHHEENRGCFEGEVNIFD